MLLQIMPLSHDVRHEGLSCAQLHSSDLPFGRIRLLGAHYKYLGTDAFALRRLIQERRFNFFSILSLFTTHGLVKSHGRR
jgi:hypothetical protein